MGIGFGIFLYGFLGMVASILIYNLVKLFRGLKPVGYQTEKLLPQEMEINTNGEVSDDKIKLIEKIVTEVKNENLRKALLKEIDQGQKEKPKGFWKRLWDNVKPWDRDDLNDFWEKRHRENGDFYTMLSAGIIHTSIYHQNHPRRYGK